MEQLILSQYGLFLPLILVTGFICLINPFVCLLLFCMSIPYETFLLVWPGYTLAKLLGIILLISWTVHAIAKRLIIRGNSLLLILFCLVSWAYFSKFYCFILYSDNLNVGGVYPLLQCGVMSFLLCQLVRTRRQFIVLLTLILVAAISNFVLSLSFSSEEDLKAGRLALLGGEDQNESAFMSGGLIIMVGVFFYKNKSILLKIFGGIVSIILFTFLILTGSRGCLLAFLCSSVMGILGGSFERRSKVMAGFFLLIVLFFYSTLLTAKISLPEEFAQYEKAILRLQNFVRREEDSAKTPRLEIWEKGLKYYYKRPLLGYGYATFFLHVKNAPHNDFLRVLFETGLVGFSFLSACYLISFRRIQITRKQYYPAYTEIVLFFCFISAFFLGLLQSKFFWFLFSSIWLNLTGPPFGPQSKALREQRPDDQNIDLATKYFRGRQDF